MLQKKRKNKCYMKNSYTFKIQMKAILKKMSKVSKSKEIVKEVNGVLEELKRDRDTEVIYAINDN